MFCNKVLYERQEIDPLSFPPSYALPGHLHSIITMNFPTFSLMESSRHFHHTLACFHAHSPPQHDCDPPCCVALHASSGSESSCNTPVFSLATWNFLHTWIWGKDRILGVKQIYGKEYQILRDMEQ